MCRVPVSRLFKRITDCYAERYLPRESRTRALSAFILRPSWLIPRTDEWRLLVQKKFYTQICFSRAIRGSTVLVSDSNARPWAINRISWETGAVFPRNIRMTRISRRFDLREFRCGTSVTRNVRNNVHSAVKRLDYLRVARYQRQEFQSASLREMYTINRKGTQFQIVQLKKRAENMLHCLSLSLLYK